MVHYQAEDISDLLSNGAIYDPKTGSAVGSSESNIQDAKGVQSAYEAFTRSYAGSKMAGQMGVPKWDAYAVMDMGDSALAATISYGDGRKVLAWNSKYLDRVNAASMSQAQLEAAVIDSINRYGHALASPEVAKAADFYEANYHEGRHYQHGSQVFNRSRAEEEYATYMETAQFYRSLAEQTKDSNYGISKFYDAIADRSEAKARIYGAGGENADFDPQDNDSLEELVVGEVN